MKKMNCLIFCVMMLAAIFSNITYAEATTAKYGDYTYDSNGNVTIGGYYVTKDSVDDFLRKAGEAYSVTSIKLESSINAIGREAFSGCKSTLKEINIPINVRRFEYNIFGESHNVQIKYSGDEEHWNSIYKANDAEYYGNVEFYSDGYARINEMSVEAYQNKVFGQLYFAFAAKDCVAEFQIYTCSNDERELNNTYTLNIPSGTNTINYSFDFVSDGKTHLISVAVYDNLTDKTQWGAVCEREFTAYDNSLICSNLFVDSSDSKLKLFMDFLFVEKDSVAFVEIFDLDENESLSFNKSFIIDLAANNEHIEYDIPLELDNKDHQ